MKQTIKHNARTLMKYSVLSIGLALAGLNFGGKTNKAHADTQTSSQRAVENSMHGNQSQQRTGQAQTGMTEQGHSNQQSIPVLFTSGVHQVTVQNGDTLSKLAIEYNTSVNRIEQDNNMSNDTIIVGQKLTIASGSTQLHPQSQTMQLGGSVNNNVNVQVPSVNTGTQSEGTGYSGSTGSQSYNSGDSYDRPSYHSASQSQSNILTSSERSTSSSSNLTGDAASARNWIASHESGGNYGARNGAYYGKYQLNVAYLHGNYSPANQDATANRYVNSRYGGWVPAQHFWASHGWY